MTNPAVIPFAFEDHLVRVVMRDGEPWFVAKDVCDVLGLAKHDTALGRLDDDEKGSHTVGTPGGPQQVSVVSESGLYALMFSSRKEEARRLRKWVTSEVMPSIRKTGAYVADGATAERVGSIGPGDDMPVALGRLKLDMVREARCNFGPAAARRLWNAIGLPTLHAEIHGRDLNSHTEGTGVMALDRILSAKCGGKCGDRTVRDLLADALDGDDRARDVLRDIGVHCREADGGVAFASSTPFMRDLFKRHPHPALTLRLISGARPMQARLFGGVPSRSTLVPMAMIENMLYGFRDEAGEDPAA